MGHSRRIVAHKNILCAEGVSQIRLYPAPNGTARFRHCAAQNRPRLWRTEAVISGAFRCFSDHTRCAGLAGFESSWLWNGFARLILGCQRDLFSLMTSSTEAPTDDLNHFCTLQKSFQNSHRRRHRHDSPALPALSNAMMLLTVFVKDSSSDNLQFPKPECPIIHNRRIGIPRVKLLTTRLLAAASYNYFRVCTCSLKVRDPRTPGNF